MSVQELKLVLLGVGGVGKSAFTARFVQGVFVEKYDPTIEDSYRKPFEADGVNYILEILDTAGTEQFSSMRDLYMKDGQGFLLIYSIIAKSTLVALEDFYKQILKVKDLQEGSSVAIVVVGNKADLEADREVKPDEGEKVAKSFGNAPHMLTSAKTGQNIEEVMTTLVRKIGRGLHPKKKSKCTLI